jgi:hypothetical protein
MWNPSQIDGPFDVPATYDEDGAPLTYRPGYHLNIDPALMSDELLPYQVPPPQPLTPFRVFAGQETIFLHFADEAEARASALGVQWTEPE